jgi:hypothetical protein
MVEPCKYEPEILLLKTELPKIEVRLREKINENRDTVLLQYNETKKSIDTLSDLLKGKNTSTPGLITKVLLNQRAIMKLWWLYAAIIAAVLGTLTKVIFFMPIAEKIAK